MTIRLIEENPRGFLSDYISMLTSMRVLENRGVDLDDVKIDPSMFSLYGNPKNWFEDSVVSSSGKNEYPTPKSWDLSMWPTHKELDLLKYTKYFPFNKRVKDILKSDKRDYSNTLGIHYRGTDNRKFGHTQYVTIDKFINSTQQELEKHSYDSIFIATDEINVVEKFKEKFSDINIFSFDHIRIDSNIGLHFSNFSKEKKIQLGDEVLVDAHTLSKCKTVIGKTSNVNNYVRIVNPMIEILYQDLDTNIINGQRTLGGEFDQIRVSDIQPFIFNWRGQYKKACAIEDSLKKIFGDVTVINSDEENTRPGWIDLGDEAYFTMQFRTALDLLKPDKKVLMHCQGDTEFDNYDQLVEDARKYFNLHEWGVYAPDVTNVWYTPENTDIEGIEFDDENLKMVACTDETVWFIHRDIIDDYYERGLDKVMTHENMKMGWGWDMVFNGISFLKSRPVIRDYNHQIQHAKGTNYNKSSAGEEMMKLVESIQPDLRQCISYIKGDRENIVRYFGVMKDFLEKNKSTHKLKDLPPIYWVNLDSDTHRSEYMEEQFKYWQIKNHTRVSGFDGRSDDVCQYLSGRAPDNMSESEIGCCMSHIKAIKDFYENTDEPYALIFEDDVVLELAKYWNFTWKEFVSKLPHDWDCVQLSVISTGEIHIQLHNHFINDFSAAAYLITRHHASKILKNHTRGKKYKLDNGVKPRAVSEDVIFGSGKTYSIPLFLYKLDLGSAIHPEHIEIFHRNSYQVLLNFWQTRGCQTDLSLLMRYDPYLGKISNKANK